MTYKLQDVYDSANRELFTVISTFAGGGGSSTGYKLSGGKILAFNEFVDAAVNTYLENYPNTPHLDGDIKNIDGQDFLNLTNLKVGELDIFDGSPPCSAFSTNGKRNKGWNKTKNYSDGKKVTNIEDLFLEYIRVANGLQAKVMIAENVAGLLESAAAKKFSFFFNEIEKIGYTMTYFKLNAKDYGTSQSRTRVFIVGIRNDVLDDLGIDRLCLYNLLKPKPQAIVPLGSVIGDIENDVDELKLLIEAAQKNPTTVKYLNAMPKNPLKVLNASNLDKSINPTSNYFNLYRCSAYSYSPVITALGASKLGISSVMHYNEDRKFTVKELKRVMGLPDDYRLSGTREQQCERIGRMVAPLCLTKLVDKIYENILKPYNLKNKGVHQL